MPRGEQIPPWVVKAVLGKKDEGVSPNKIADFYGHKRSWYYYVIKTFSPATGQPLLPGQKGRPKATDLADEATIWGTSSALRHESIDDITKAVHDAGVTASRATIHRRMVDKEICRRPTVWNILNKPQRETRYDFAMTMKRLLDEDPRRVNHFLFTDEMRIDLKLKGRHRVSKNYRFDFVLFLQYLAADYTVKLQKRRGSALPWHAALLPGYHAYERGWSL